MTTPVILPNGGAIGDNDDITIATSTAGATIYYTTDGTDPTIASTVYSAPFTLDADATVKAFAVKTGFGDSAVASASFTFIQTVATPTLSPAGGTFSDSVTVSLQTSTPGATIYYTTNGTTPSTASTAYTGSFTLTADATVSAFAVATGYDNSAVASADFTVTTSSSGQQPYGSTPWPVPGLVETENYDEGGEGVAYHDKKAGNTGAVYRTDDVDIWPSNDTGDAGYYVAVATTEWLEFTVDVATAGQYTLYLRATTPFDGRRLHVEVDGNNVTGTINVPNTGSWQSWQTLSVPGTLAAGQHVMRLVGDEGQVNVNWMDFYETGGTATVATPTISPAGGTFSDSVTVSLQTSTPGATIYYTTNGTTPSTASTAYTGSFTLTADATVSAFAVATGYDNSAVASADFTVTTSSSGQQPYGSTPWPVPGLVETENYDEGGEGVAYHDKRAGNTGAVYRTDDVDIWPSNDTGDAGYYVAVATTEWLEFTVDVATAGQYTLYLRATTPFDGRRLHVEVDGNNVTGTINVPNTGSWQLWQTLSVPVTLAAGQQVMRLVGDEGQVNVNWMELTNGSSGPTSGMETQFNEVTSNAGLQYTGESYGASWGDMNGDGWYDLWVGNHGYRGNGPGLYRNNGDGTFTNVASALVGYRGDSDVHGSAWADFDNDGDQDLYVTTGADKNRCLEPHCGNQLFVNEGGAFEDLSRYDGTRLLYRSSPRTDLVRLQQRW